MNIQTFIMINIDIIYYDSKSIHLLLRSARRKLDPRWVKYMEREGILAHSSLATLCILVQRFWGAVDLCILWGDKLEAEHMESVKTAKIS